MKNKVVTRFKARMILDRWEACLMSKFFSVVLLCICRGLAIGRPQFKDYYETFSAFTASKLDLNRNKKKGLTSESKERLVSVIFYIVHKCLRCLR
jgi:hypothetical protein